MIGDPSGGSRRDGGHQARRFATFAEKRPAATEGDAPSPPPPGEEARALAEQWRLFNRLATVVAILTAPMFFLLMYRVAGWGAAAATILTILAVVAFRGLVDVVTRRLIPAPSLFHSDDALRRADVTERRRAWFWRGVYRAVWFLACLYATIVVIVYVVQAITGDADLSAALAAPFEAIADEFEGTDTSRNLVGLAVGLVVILFANVVIFLGPMLYAGMKQIRYYEPGDADWGVRLDDVRGQAEPREEIRRIISLWQSSEAFQRAGGTPERGILFMGAPGTGKTMMAKAIATGFNCPFVTAPGPAFAQSFIGVDVMLVMWMSWRARRLSRKWGGKCIVFIDEIDAIGMSRAALAGSPGAAARPSVHDVAFHGPMGAITQSGDLILESEPWRERLFRSRAADRYAPGAVARLALRVRNFVMPGLSTGPQAGLQYLLVVMDGVESPPPMRRSLTNRLNTLLDALYVVPPRIGRVPLRVPPARPRHDGLYFLGACNVPLWALDPALTRPGRLGRHIWFRTPNRADRRDIFDLYLGRVAHEPELDAEHRRDELARITMGHSPAMIQQVCSIALTSAHHDGRARCSWDDLVAAITLVEAGTAEGISYQPDEARALAIHEAGHAVTGHVYMREWTSTRLTITARGGALGHHSMGELEERYSRFQHEEFANLVWSLGAMAAEHVFYGESSWGVGGDVAGATTTAAFMVGRWGMAPTRPDLRGRFDDPVAAEVAERKLMRRFEQIGVRIMNRTSQGGGLDDDPVAAVLADPSKRAMVAQLLGQAFLAAYWFVLHNREGTERVARTLLERREMFGDEVVELLESADLRIPDIDPLDEANWPRI
jgi:SpoVK/Ycf46/Vps4 family AAA+-type ATPase